MDGRAQSGRPNGGAQELRAPAPKSDWDGVLPNWALAARQPTDGWAEGAHTGVDLELQHRDRWRRLVDSRDDAAFRHGRHRGDF
jgi:hypothetical protein